MNQKLYTIFSNLKEFSELKSLHCLQDYKTVNWLSTHAPKALHDWRLETGTFTYIYIYIYLCACVWVHVCVHTCINTLIIHKLWQVWILPTITIGIYLNMIKSKNNWYWHVFRILKQQIQLFKSVEEQYCVRLHHACNVLNTIQKGKSNTHAQTHNLQGQ